MRSIWLAALLVCSAAAAVEPAELLSQIRSTTPDGSSAVSVREVEIEIGPALFEIERGILVPAKTSQGRMIELIFVGHARFHLEAPDDIEAGQLELFTGERSLEAPVEEAVLVLSDEAALDRLLATAVPRNLRTEQCRWR